MDVIIKNRGVIGILMHFLDILSDLCQGCRNGRLENCVFVPCRKQVVLMKIGGNSDIAFYPPKKQGALQLNENDENGGCHPGKMTVCQSTGG